MVLCTWRSWQVEKQSGIRALKFPDFFIPTLGLKSDPWGLISKLYSLLSFHQDKIIGQNRTKWEKVLGEISKDNWEDVLVVPKKILPRYPISSIVYIKLI